MAYPYIAYVYADLIRKEKKTIDEVPERVRMDVEAILAGDKHEDDSV